ADDEDAFRECFHEWERFRRITKAATPSTLRPKITLRARAGTSAFAQTPMVIPIAEPPRNRPARVQLPEARCEAFATKPDAAMSEIPTSDVASARSMLTQATTSSAGTMRNPPPTPKTPDSTPEIAPAPKSFPAQERLKWRCPFEWL